MKASKVVELFANPQTHLLVNSCFSESLVQAASMEGKFKSIFSHKIRLHGTTDAVATTRACMSALVQPGGVTSNVAKAAEAQLEAENYKFIKLCDHERCQCEAKGLAMMPFYPVAQACVARNKKRSADEVSAYSEE